MSNNFRLNSFRCSKNTDQTHFMLQNVSGIFKLRLQLSESTMFTRWCFSSQIIEGTNLAICKWQVMSFHINAFAIFTWSISFNTFQYTFIHINPHISVVISLKTKCIFILAMFMLEVFYNAISINKHVMYNFHSWLTLLSFFLDNHHRAFPPLRQFITGVFPGNPNFLPFCLISL